MQQSVEIRHQRKEVAIDLLLKLIAQLFNLRRFSGHLLQIGFVFTVAGEPQRPGHQQYQQQRQITRPEPGAVAQLPPAVAARQTGLLENHIFQHPFKEKALPFVLRDGRLFIDLIPAS